MKTFNENQKYIPFANIINKDFHCKLVAWRAVSYITRQQKIVRSDSRIIDEQILRSENIELHRSGNEMIIIFPKISGILSRGFTTHADIELIVNA